MKGVENMLQMQEIVFYWVGKRIYGPDLRSVDQPEAFWISWKVKSGEGDWRVSLVSSPSHFFFRRLFLSYVPLQYEAFSFHVHASSTFFFFHWHFLRHSRYDAFHVEWCPCLVDLSSFVQCFWKGMMQFSLTNVLWTCSSCLLKSNDTALVQLTKKKATVFWSSKVYPQSVDSAVRTRLLVRVLLSNHEALS